MKGPSQNDEPMSDINVTPFVDVLLVLLIIFMITAPIIQNVVEIDLPQDNYEDNQANLDQTLRIVIDPSGTIYINKDRIGNALKGEALSLFQQRINEWNQGKPKPWGR